jgi:hypothetical protein
MDNSTQQPTVNNQQLADASQADSNVSVQQAVGTSTSLSEDAKQVSTIQTKPVPNRGGIPVVPVQPAVPTTQITEPVLPVAEIPQIDTVADQLDPIVMPVNSQSAEIIPEVQAITQTDANQSAIPQPGTSPKNREHEPAAFPDVVKMSEQQVQDEEKKVEGEIESLIEESPDTEQPKISHELKIVGVEKSIDDIANSVIQPAGQVPILPMTFDEAELTRKKYKWKDSIAWLSDLIIYHWKKLSFKRKES